MEKKQNRFFLTLLVLAACAVTTGRILSVPGPFGPNDMSRWATVAALVETGDFSIGRRITDPNGGYRDQMPPVMIDVLLHPETQQFYSSKPPLLPVLLAGEMLLMKRALGWNPREHGARMLRIMLLTFNAVPIALFLIAFLFTLERLRASDRAVAFLMTAAGFGTVLTTFGTTITNHVGATAAAGLALLALVRVFFDRERSAKWFLLAGFGAGWTASQEVPALCFLPLVAFPLYLRDPRRTLALFLPAALLPVAAFFTTNHLALGDPFWFYHPDRSWSKFPGSYWTQKVGIDRGEASHAAYVFHFTFGHHGAFSLAPIFLASLVAMIRLLKRSFLESALASLLLFVAVIVLRHAYHELGVPLPLVLAPLGLAAGAALGLPRGWWREEAREAEVLPRIAAAATLLTFGFYLLHTSNYGGVACGPRWLMWLIPLWLVAALPVVEQALESRRTRWLLLAALALSIVSASHPGLNPWTHPWLYELF